MKIENGHKKSIKRDKWKNSKVKEEDEDCEQ